MIYIFWILGIIIYLLIGSTIIRILDEAKCIEAKYIFGVLVIIWPLILISVLIRDVGIIIADWINNIRNGGLS